MGPIVYPERSVVNYHYSLRNNPEERSSHKKKKIPQPGAKTKKIKPFC